MSSPIEVLNLRSSTPGGMLNPEDTVLALVRGCGIIVVSVLALVERFDIEPYSDFSAKLSNFRELILVCIDAKFCKKIFVGKLLTRSTRFTCFCTAQTSIFQQNFVKLFRIFRHLFFRADVFEEEIRKDQDCSAEN